MKPLRAELRLRDHRDLAIGERGMALHVGGLGWPLAVLLLPADRVQHRAVHPDAEAGDAVTAGRDPGGDRRERGGRGRRDDGGDRPPLERRELGQQRGVTGPRLPAQAVEDEEHDGARAGDRRRAATRRAGPRGPPAPRSSRWGPNSRVSRASTPSRYSGERRGHARRTAPRTPRLAPRRATMGECTRAHGERQRAQHEGLDTR